MSIEFAERKKMSNMYILEILKKYTEDDNDPKHCLSQRQILEKLESDFGLTVDRKAVMRGLNDLIDSELFSNNIIYETVTRNSKTNSEMKTNFRYCHEFDNEQVQLLINSVIFSKIIPDFEKNCFIEKLSKLGSNNKSNELISKYTYYLSRISADMVTNNQIMNNIGVISEAIEEKKKIRFTYNMYGKDKKLHPKLDGEGNRVINTASPYVMISTNGRYYLLCNYDEHDNIINVRIDKITDVEILDEPVKCKTKIKDYDKMFKTQAELLYMQPGNTERIVFKATNNPNIISELIDWFGGSIKFLNEDEKFVTCQVSSNPRAIRFWAMQYSDHVEILEPESLREDLRITLRSAWRKYNNGNDQLIEPVDEIRKLISEWQIIIKKGISQEEENRKSDIENLGKIVRKTHSVLLPIYGKEPEGQYIELVYNLRKLKDSIYHLSVTQKGMKRIIGAFIDKIYESNLFIRDEYPIDFLHICVNHVGYNNSLNIDINHFEEDYEVLEKLFVKESAYINERNKKKREEYLKNHPEKSTESKSNSKKRPRIINTENRPKKDICFKRISEEENFNV